MATAHARKAQSEEKIENEAKHTISTSSVKT
jgi:hypothetical protein